MSAARNSVNPCPSVVELLLPGGTRKLLPPGPLRPLAGSALLLDRCATGTAATLTISRRVGLIPHGQFCGRHCRSHPIHWSRAARALAAPASKSQPAREFDARSHGIVSPLHGEGDAGKLDRSSVCKGCPKDLQGSLGLSPPHTLPRRAPAKLTGSGSFGCGWP